MKYLKVIVIAVAVSAGCGGPAEVLDSGEDGSIEAPYAKADGVDVADTECRVVLRRVRFKTSNASLWVTFNGQFDVAIELLEAGDAAVMYKATSEKRWVRGDVKKVGGAPAGYQRFSFRLDNATITPHDVLFERDSMDILPFVRTATGRIIDKNVLGEQTAYPIQAPKFDYTAGPGVCSAPGEAPTSHSLDVAPTASVGTVTVRTGKPTGDPCKTAAAYEDAITVHNYQQTAADTASHVCIKLPPKTNSLEADAYDLRIHYRYREDAKYTQDSVAFDKKVGSSPQYKVDLWTLDPMEESGCPSGNVALEHKEGDYDMWARASFYFTIGKGEENRTEIRPGAGRDFEALYGAFLEYHCLH